MATPLRKQAPWMIIIIIVTILLLGAIFVGFWALQNASEREYSEQIELDTQAEIAGQVEVRNQVVVLYVNTPSTVEKFGLTFTVKEHALVSDRAVETTIEVSGNGKSSDVQFTELEQVVEWESYQFQLRSALDNSLQIVVSQQQE